MPLAKMSQSIKVLASVLVPPDQLVTVEVCPSLPLLSL